MCRNLHLCLMLGRYKRVLPYRQLDRMRVPPAVVGRRDKEICRIEA
jgi:hypothetical protein